MLEESKIGTPKNWNSGKLEYWKNKMMGGWFAATPQQQAIMQTTVDIDDPLLKDLRKIK
jgi:hypothetical protein